MGFWTLVFLVHSITGVAAFKLAVKRGHAPLWCGIAGLIFGIAGLLALFIYFRIYKNNGKADKVYG
jgi:uncharacterized membrane protein YuzA (DUF378 family)